MLHCPNCKETIALSRRLNSRAPGFKFHRESMQFRLECPSCGNVIGLGRFASHLFFIEWLGPLPLLAWLAHGVGFVQVHSVLALPVAWLLLFPLYGLGRARLVCFEPADSPRPSDVGAP